MQGIKDRLKCSFLLCILVRNWYLLSAVLYSDRKAKELNARSEYIAVSLLHIFSP